MEKIIEQKLKPGPKYLRTLFFISGIVATIAYRITFLFDPFWSKAIWYVGTIGFALYFGHRMHVENKRAELVEEYNLIDEVNQSPLPEEKRAALSYLIKTSLTSKVRYNSAFIFIASVIAFIVSFALDIYHII